MELRIKALADPGFALESQLIGLGLVKAVSAYLARLSSLRIRWLTLLNRDLNYLIIIPSNYF
jgi:hypothetical protein